MKILQFTSLLFATVTIHAFYTQNILYHNLSLLITVFSILTHGYGYDLEITDKPINNCLKNIDRLVAHFTFLFILFNDTPRIMQKQPLIVIFPVLLLTIWILEYMYPDEFILFHSIFHLVSIATLHVHLYYLNLLNL
jgi:hypothetical protein